MKAICLSDFLGLGCFAIFSKKGKAGRDLEKEEPIERRRRRINRGFRSKRERTSEVEGHRKRNKLHQRRKEFGVEWVEGHRRRNKLHQRRKEFGVEWVEGLP